MNCRLCLTDLNSVNSVSLYDELGSNIEPQLVKIIGKYFYLNISWTDEISTAICHECCKNLNEFQKFCEYITEQQIMLSNMVPVFDYEKASETAEPAEVHIKSQTENGVYIAEIHVKCEPEEDVSIMGTRINFEPNITMDDQLQCESEKATSTEMALISSSISNHSVISSYSEPSSSLFSKQTYCDGFDQILHPLYAVDSSDYVLNERAYSVPDVTSIKLFPPINIIYQSFLMGTPIKNKDRIQIAKSVIEECLYDAPERKFTREDFIKLSENIKKIFPSENMFTYFNPRVKDKNASGKLWIAYKIKKSELIASGRINRRTNTCLSKKITPDLTIDHVFGNNKIKVTPVTKKIPLTPAERSRRYRAKKKEQMRKHILAEWNESFY